MLAQLINNAALLLALGVLYDTVARPEKENLPLWRHTLVGLVLGVMGIAVMLNPWRFAAGVVFDTRSVLLSVSGLFFHPLPVLIAALMMTVFRLYQGGSGAWAGVGTIIVSVVMGMLWRRWQRSRLPEIRTRELYLFGLLTHVAVLACMLGLPRSTAFQVLAQVGPLMMLIHPVTTALLGRLLAARLARQRDRAVLRENLVKYRTLFEAAPFGLTVADAHNRIVESNPMAEELLGLGVDEQKRRTVDSPEWQVIRPDGSPMPPQEFASSRAMAEKRLIENVDMGLVKPDGAVTWISVTSAPLPLEGYGVIIAYNDIGERMRAQEALRASEAHMRRVVENMPVLLDAWDEQNRIVAWNRECERVTGYSAEEVLGDPHILERLYPDAAYREQMIAQAAALGFDFYNQEWELTCKNDDKRIVAWSNISRRFPIPGWHTWATGIDVTDYRRSQAEVVRLASFPQLNPYPVIELDRAGAVTFCNLAALQVLASLGRVGEVQALLPPDLPDILQRLARDEQAYLEREVVLGETIWGELISLVPQFQTLRIYARDVTARRRAEAQVQADLVEKEALLREVHHRVKNNLQVICSLLDFQAQYTRYVRARTVLQTTQQRVRAMALVIEMLYQQDNLAVIEMDAYIHNLVQELWPEFEEQSSGLDIRIEAQNVFLELSQAMPCGLLINELVSNTLKHAFPAQAAHLPLPHRIDITIDKTPSKEYHLVIRDNGIGLPPHFEFPNSQTLGMFLLDTMVRQLKGRIAWCNDPGVCCRVTFAVSGLQGAT